MSDESVLQATANEPSEIISLRIGLCYPIRGEALMKEPFLESFSNTSFSLKRRISSPVLFRNFIL